MKYTESKSGFESGVLEDVAFFWTKIQTPGKKFESEDTEWCTTVVMTKAQANELKAKLPKVNPKPVPNDDFVERFKVDVPFPEESIQYVYKLQRNTIRGNGEPVEEEKAPRVIFTRPDGVNVNITKKVLVGNGSRGDALFFVSDTRFGKFPKLKDIIVTKLVPYEAPEGDNGFMEVVEASDEDLDALLGVEGLNEKAEVTEKATKGETKSTKATGVPVTDDQLPW